MKVTSCHVTKEASAWWQCKTFCDSPPPKKKTAIQAYWNIVKTGARRNVVKCMWWDASRSDGESVDILVGKSATICLWVVAFHFSLNRPCLKPNELHDLHTLRKVGSPPPPWSGLLGWQGWHTRHHLCISTQLTGGYLQGGLQPPATLQLGPDSVKVAPALFLDALKWGFTAESLLRTYNAANLSQTSPFGFPKVPFRCESHPAAKGVRQKESGKKWRKSDISVRKSDQKVTKYIYIYIWIWCEVIIWAKFGHFRCYYLGQVGVIIWAKLFLAYKKIVVSSDVWHTQLSFCVFFVPNYLAVI